MESQQIDNIFELHTCVRKKTGKLKTLKTLLESVSPNAELEVRCMQPRHWCSLPFDFPYFMEDVTEANPRCIVKTMASTSNLYDSMIQLHKLA